MVYDSSRLLDMRDCTRPEWINLNRRMKGLESKLQPFWFRPFMRLKHVRQRLVYDCWSRCWEYPWAELSANIRQGLRVLDVGSGGSAFPLLLALEGCEVHCADPSLVNNEVIFGPRMRMVRRLGITTLWGSPPHWGKARVPVAYVPDPVQNLRYVDGYFDRVFCLSVLEHMPELDWQRAIGEMSRVLKNGGRLIVTLDMASTAADLRQYEKLLSQPSLRLLGSVDYAVPISLDDKLARHPGVVQSEILGLIWDKVCAAQ